jgi:hypothetical protein
MISIFLSENYLVFAIDKTLHLFTRLTPLIFSYYFTDITQYICLVLSIS